MKSSIWPTVRIDQVGEVQAGRQRSASITAGRPRPYLRVANVFDGYIDSSDVLKMPFTDEEYKTYLLRPGDILLNEGQSLELVGRSAIYGGDPPGCCFQNTLIRFRPKSEITTAFARQLFQHLQYSGAFSAIAVKTTSIAHLGVERFASLRVPVPPLEEQQRIANLLGVWDAGIRYLTDRITKKLQLKQALMQQLLTGKRRFREFIRPWEERVFGSFLSESREPGSNGAEARRLSVRLYGKGVYPKDDTRPGSTATQNLFHKWGFA
jgi:type I restriction enzyme S subunit